MGTLAGVGCSFQRDPEEAGREAATQALHQIDRESPDFVFVFATVGYDQQRLIAAIRESTLGAPLSGCSGEGIITNGVVAEVGFGVCVMAITSDELRFDSVHVTDMTRHPNYAGGELAARLRPLLKQDTIAAFLFVDGLVFDFDPFLSAFEAALLPQRPPFFFGGLASDNWVSRKTYQYHDGEVFSEGISCVVMSGSGTIAYGVNHGCVPIGTKHIITRSMKNRIYEIDGIPVLQMLRDYVEGDLDAQWNKTSLNLCLGFETPGYMKREYGEYIVRYMMGKNNEEGYVTIQSDVSDGTELWIVRRDKELIRHGLQGISERIAEQSGGCAPKFVLQFECMGRGKVVFREQEKTELLTSLQRGVGAGVPWIGFYTYGEIGPVAGHNCLHNFTAVVTAVC